MMLSEHIHSISNWLLLVLGVSLLIIAISKVVSRLLYDAPRAADLIMQGMLICLILLTIISPLLKVIGL